MWENGTIVYDIRPQQAADTATGQPAETDLQYSNRLTASAAYAETFTLYLGDEEQTADPTIEAIEGFGNVPGWRGRAYIVYPNRNLQTAQGWRHPNFTFEVFQNGIGACTDSTETSNEILYPWIGGGLTEDPTNPLNLTNYYIKFVDNHVPNPPPGGQGSIAYTRLDDALGVVESFYGFAVDVFLSYGVSALDSDDLVANIAASGGNNVGAHPEARTAQLHFNVHRPGFIDPSSGAGPFFPPNYYNAFSPPPAPFYTPGVYWWQSGINLTTSTAIGSGAPPLVTPWLNFQGGGAGFAWYQTLDAVIYSVRSPGVPADPCLGLPVSPVTGYAVRPDGKLVKCGPWTLDTTNTYKVLQQFTGGANSVVKPLNPTILEGSGSDTEAFWTAAYNAAVTAGDMVPGLAFGSGYPFRQSWGYTIDQQICEGAGGEASIADIIAALCSRAGLSAIDVSDLVSSTVSGYSISSVSDATNCIQPLRSIAFFDAVESAGILRFQTRGKAIVAALTADEIGAFDGGSSGATVPPSLTVARVDETTLPRSIRLHYKSVARDYQDAQQSSPFRLTTKAINDQDVSLPFCMGDTQALQCAEILWSDAWAGKNTYTLSIDQSLSEIEVGDALGIPVDNVLQRARIISEQNSSGVLRKLSLVSDNEGAYISFAIAEPSQVAPQILRLLAGTMIELLDLPALQDADNDPGFYLAAQRTGAGNDWRGCVLYKSVDSGATWVSMFSIVVESTYGTLHATPAASQYFTWDDTTLIVIDLASTNFSLESRTDEAVLAGANAAAIGADGRWEIIQFANATQLSATQWQLSRLLRGRRGTEHNIGRNFTGDAFVMLTAGALSRIPLTSGEIGALRQYDAPSIGASFSSGVVYPFAGHAMALMPFSPVDVRAELESNGDILISWTRRDRLGRTLMSGVDMPLSEATLAFQLDVIDGSPPVAIRTLSTATTSVVYTHAHQVADFGSPLPATLNCAVYQMSAIVGRGTPAIQVLTIGA